MKKGKPINIISDLLNLADKSVWLISVTLQQYDSFLLAIRHIFSSMFSLSSSLISGSPEKFIPRICPSTEGHLLEAVHFSPLLHC